MSFSIQLFKENWKSGLTVALVSIPLSVSLALASGATPTAGIITAIWAGAVAALFGGSHFNVVGPTGALSGILAAYALVHGVDALSMLAILSGIFILCAYALHLEKFLVFVPASTIHGFTLGVAFIIAANQLNFALGLSDLQKHEHVFANIVESFVHVGASVPETFLLFTVGLILLLVLAKRIPRLPGAILLAPAGILLGYLASSGTLPFHFATLGSQFPTITPKLLDIPAFGLESQMILPALTIALVAILESMISAKIADGMTKTKHHKRKEVFGLGLANIFAGLAGGIPATAALARTSLNIKSGANNRLSALLSVFGIVIISLLFLSTFRYIPLAVIASILVFIAIRMVEMSHFTRMWKTDRKSFAIALFVAAITVLEDPMIGILAGTVIALLMFMEKLSRGQFDLVVNDANKHIIGKVTAEKLSQIEEEGETIVYSIKGQLAYINSVSHVTRFEQLNGYKNVILRLRELSFIDLDGVDAFEEIVEMIHAQGKSVLVTGAHPLIETMLRQSKAFLDLEKKGLVFKRTTEALASLGY